MPYYNSYHFFCLVHHREINGSKLCLVSLMFTQTRTNTLKAVCSVYWLDMKYELQYNATKWNLIVPARTHTQFRTSAASKKIYNKNFYFYSRSILSVFGTVYRAPILHSQAIVWCDDRFYYYSLYTRSVILQLVQAIFEKKGNFRYYIYWHIVCSGKLIDDAHTPKNYVYFFRDDNFHFL